MRSRRPGAADTPPAASWGTAGEEGAPGSCTALRASQSGLRLGSQVGPGPAQNGELTFPSAVNQEVSPQPGRLRTSDLENGAT